MTGMLTVLALINFLDKIVLCLVVVPLVAGLHLSAQQFGLIAGSFFWLFSISTVVVSFPSNRVRTRWVLLAMGVSWAGDPNSAGAYAKRHRAAGLSRDPGCRRRVVVPRFRPRALYSTSGSRIASAIYPSQA